MAALRMNRREQFGSAGLSRAKSRGVSPILLSSVGQRILTREDLQ
jgi:hypothetical protein